MPREVDEKILLEKTLKPVYLDVDERELVWLDVSRIPWEEVWIRSSDLERIARAIENMEIRGAPAIGVAAALTLAMIALRSSADTISRFVEEIQRASDRLSRTRPTAVNLFWALERINKRIREGLRENLSLEELRSLVVDEALKIQREDLEANIRIGRYGSELVEDGDTILTHCNTGSLATAGFGTALGVIRYAWAQGKNVKVIATETRPILQGARLTVWELMRDGIPVRLITDNMIGYVMSKGLVNKVIVGADRVLRSGHVINKIGTYTIAIVSSYHKIPFYVAIPRSTLDLETSLADVVIEERRADEVRTVMNRLYITLRDVEVINPAFDITPPSLVSAIITDAGIVKPPYEENLKKLLGR
ncbi:MAG: S-methyl-5-thioribose-1-phosphate isomerase [Sulfolobales archaeon]